MGRHTLTAVVLTALVGFAAAGANAANQIDTYSVTPAASTHSPYSGGHLLWLPGSGVPNGGNSKFVPYNSTPLTLTVVTDMNTGQAVASLTGTVQGLGDAASIWDVAFDFVQNDARLPKLELYSSNYTANGGTIDPSTWVLFDLAGATLTGNAAGRPGDIGKVLTVTQRGLPNYAFQLGDGANGKNLNLGFSGWINYAGDYAGHGDVNADLNLQTTVIPEPASLALLGLGGLMIVRRR